MIRHKVLRTHLENHLLGSPEGVSPSGKEFGGCAPTLSFFPLSRLWWERGTQGVRVFRQLLILIVLLGTLALGAACTQAGGSTPTPGDSSPVTVLPGDGTGLPVIGAPAGDVGSSQQYTGSSPATGYSTFASQLQAYGTQQSGIWVSGSGRVVVVPDLALLSLGVEARAKTVQQARDQAATAMDQVMAVLTKAGIEKKDIQTQYFNIQPEYVWNDFAKRQEITGYTVTNTISVKS
ncbi:MAG: SIMPL domain-containing protein, partial [Chloroflexota bacterium]